MVVAGMDSIDASAVNTGFIAHTYYGDKRSIVSDIFYVICNELPPERRSGIVKVERFGVEYWSIVP